MGDASVGDGRVPFLCDPCLFPALNTLSGEKQDLQESVPVELNPRDDIDTFCKSRGIELPQLLQVAWAIVLRVYTASEYALFRYAEGRNSSLLCSLDFSENQEDTSALAQKMAVWEDYQTDDAERRLNSAVTWNNHDPASRLHQVGSQSNMK